MRNTHVIINIIECNREIQKIHTSGKSALEEAKKQLEEKYLQTKKRE